MHLTLRHLNMYVTHSHHVEMDDTKILRFEFEATSSRSITAEVIDAVGHFELRLYFWFYA